MRSCCCRLRGVLKRSRDVYPSSHDMLPIVRAWYAVSSTFGKTLQPHGSARVRGPRFTSSQTEKKICWDLCKNALRRPFIEVKGCNPFATAF